MVRKSMGSRALQIAGGLALSAVSILAQADPISVQAACALTSIVAGKGLCQVQFLVSDSYLTPVNIKSALIRVDNIVVYRYVNDTANIVPGTVNYLSGGVNVACGASHAVTAYVTNTGTGTASRKVGMTPAVTCPVAP